MIKKVVFVMGVLFASSGVQAEGQWGVGIGKPYGGFIGGRYMHNTDDLKLYLGGGLLGYSSSEGYEPGFALGFDYRIAHSKHAVGASFGTVHASRINGKKESYIGPAVNYSYYFSGFNRPSWIIGGSVFRGDRDVPNDGFEEDRSGLFINVGYQF